MRSLIVTATAIASLTPAIAQPNPATHKTGCETRYTQAEYQRQVEGVYQRKRITRQARSHLKEMRRCQHSSKAHAKTLQFTVKVRVKRRLLKQYKNPNVVTGYLKAKRKGWSGQQFNCLYSLWNHESGWDHNKYNKSGAGGIPQSLPASKMATAGPDWATNPSTQIDWGLWYIEGRYGVPCGALAHWQANGWY